MPAKDSQYTMLVLSATVERAALAAFRAWLEKVGWTAETLVPHNRSRHEWTTFFIPSVQQYFANVPTELRGPGPHAWVHTLEIPPAESELLLSAHQGVHSLCLQDVTCVSFSTGIVLVGLRLAPTTAEVDASEVLPQFVRIVGTLARLDADAKPNRLRIPGERCASLPFSIRELAAGCLKGSPLLARKELVEARRHDLQHRHAALDRPVLSEKASTEVQGAEASVPSPDDSLGLKWRRQRTAFALTFIQQVGAEPDTARCAADLWRLQHAYTEEHLPAARDLTLTEPSILELGRGFLVACSHNGVAILHRPESEGQDDARRAARVRRAYFLHAALVLHQRLELARLLERAAALPVLQQVLQDPTSADQVKTLRSDMLEFTLRHRFAVVSEEPYYLRFYERLSDAFRLESLLVELRDETEALARLSDEQARDEAARARDLRGLRTTEESKLLGRMLAGLGGLSLALSMLSSSLPYVGHASPGPTKLIVALLVAVLPSMWVQRVVARTTELDLSRRS